MNRTFIFSSNSENLSWKEWMVVLTILAGIFYYLPGFWSAIEQFNPPPDYRRPYQLSDDYWMFTRWSKYACLHFPVLIIGDSFIWGHYVPMDQTLSHYLNELEGENVFANMGVDGLHQAAMAGLLKYYGKKISNKGVIIHLNLLWMSSPKHDLSGNEELRFNHPGLIPQFIPNLACYRPSFTQRIGVVADRNFPFFGVAKHVRNVYFENMNIQDWLMQNPYKNPLSVISLKIADTEDRPQSKPVTWVERGIKQQNLPWVEVDESFQWGSLKKVIEILRERDNKVFVLLGPFNPYILTEESFGRYRSMKAKMEMCFQENNVNYYSVQDLPSVYYADASHPLKEGYRKIAEDLHENESFRKWINTLKGGSL